MRWDMRQMIKEELIAKSSYREANKFTCKLFILAAICDPYHVCIII